jgi:hypothetical protein
MVVEGPVRALEADGEEVHEAGAPERGSHDERGLRHDGSRLPS